MYVDNPERGGKKKKLSFRKRNIDSQSYKVLKENKVHQTTTILDAFMN